MRRRDHITRLLAAGACAAALAGAGCGSDEEGEQLPVRASEALRAQLQSIQNRVDNGSVGACRDITDGPSANTESVNQILEGLPEEVDPDVRDATRESFDRLFELVGDECAELEDETDTETTPTQTETAPPETETETVPPETETETVPPETTPVEPPGNNGNGNENGNGNGGGALAPGAGE